MVTGKTADVIVVGAGTAALCAALSAREDGCEVLALEKEITAGLEKLLHEVEQ